MLLAQGTARGAGFRRASLLVRRLKRPVDTIRIDRSGGRKGAAPALSPRRPSRGDGPGRGANRGGWNPKRAPRVLPPTSDGQTSLPNQLSRRNGGTSRTSRGISKTLVSARGAPAGSRASRR